MNGDGLRDVRRTLRLSQAALTSALNASTGRHYDKPKISRWENGREPIPVDVEAELLRMVEIRPMNARVVVLANQKGGVGKTTSALNLAYSFQKLNRRVLLIDLDPQATATTGLLAGAAVEAYRRGHTMAQVILTGKALADVVIKRGEPLVGNRTLSFDLAASHIELSETDGKREPGFDLALRESMQAVCKDYDWIVVDAPPNLGMLTWMALAAAEQVIIPVRTEPYDTMGVGLILNTINKVQRRLNPSLRLAGILPTQYDRRKTVDREVLAHLAASLGHSTALLTPVPNSAVFGQAARDGRIATEAAPTSSGAIAYSALAVALVQGIPLPRAVLETPNVQPTEERNEQTN